MSAKGQADIGLVIQSLDRSTSETGAVIRLGRGGGGQPRKFPPHVV